MSLTFHNLIHRARIFGCSFRPTDIHEDHRGAPRNRAQHLDAAQVMRICNRRPAPRIVKPPPTVLTPAEVDVVAPELTYSQLMEAKAQGSLSSVHVERPTPALVKEIRHKDDDTHAAKASEERPSHYTPRPQTRDGETSCSICLEGYSKQDVVRRTSCGHIFHGPCLERWLTKRRSRCPLCQSDLKMREIEEDAN